MVTPRATSDRSELDEWRETPGGHQTTTNATYRLGGDASTGISALATISGPGFTNSATLRLTIDVALSVTDEITPNRLVELWSAALFLVTTELPAALDAILPVDAVASHAELHVVAESSDGAGLNRPNDLDRRLDLSSFGEKTRPIGRSLGVSVGLGAPVAQHDSRAVVVGALRRALLDSGFTDPRAGLAALQNDS
jgi:hypothetical protein